MKAHSVVYKAHPGAAVTHNGVVESLKVDVADLRHFEEDPDSSKKRPDPHKNESHIRIRIKAKCRIRIEKPDA